MPLTARPKRPVHHKKIQAGHHRKNKHYVKAYWPYLPMFLIVGLGIMFNLSLSSGQVLGVQQDTGPEVLLKETNEARTANNRLALASNNQLQAAAQAKADDMAANNYWSHTSPSGATPWSFIAANGYQFQTAGENLAYGFDGAAQAIKAWLSSPEHRANLLSAHYTEVGFGIAQSKDFIGKGPQVIIVAEYAKPVNATSDSKFTVAGATTSTVATGNQLPSKSVSRFQSLTGSSADLGVLLVTALAAAGATLFVVRHSLQIHRLLSRGEAFIVHHPYIDISIVAFCVIAVTLTRVTGVIR